MNYDLLFSILGVLIMLALALNAFFLRGIFIDINSLKVELAVAFEKGNNKEDRIAKLEVNERELFKRINKLEVVCNVKDNSEFN